MTQRFVIAFGRRLPETDALARLAEGSAEAPADNVRVAAPGRTPPVRFNTDEGARFPPGVLAELADTDSKLARLKSTIARDLDVFAKHPRRFLDLYFAFIAARLDAAQDDLGRRLRPFGGLFKVEDWAFSALRPYPSAAILVADDVRMPTALVRHDFVFWTGAAPLAVRLQGSTAQAAPVREACERLEDHGVRIVIVTAAELAGGSDLFAAPRFPPEFLSFWDGEAYPSSPFRPQGLSAPPAAD